MSGVTAHHHDRGILALVSVERVLGDDREHLAIIVGQRPDGMDVATAESVTDAIETGTRAHQERLPPGINFHGVSKRGAEER
jgi:hypothetical protein